MKINEIFIGIILFFWTYNGFPVRLVTGPNNYRYTNIHIIK